jgi:hypothetical protein
MSSAAARQIAPRAARQHGNKPPTQRNQTATSPAATRKGMSALVEGQRAAGADAVASMGALELEDNNIHSDDGSAPLSPATDDEEPLSPCGSDNGLLASSEGEIRVGPSVTRPTAVEPTSTPPPILTDLDAPTCVICLELCGNQPVRRVHPTILH